MRKINRRLLEIELPPNRSAFLWGPRKVGKSYWIRHHLQGVPIIDLLKTDVFSEYASRPSLLRERFSCHPGLIIIDEIQKIPRLLDEIHWLIENSRVQFILTGSSAHKLRRTHANLLAGRAWKRLMTPLSWSEVSGFDLESVMISGLLPPHYLSVNPLEDLRAYVSDYLKEEIATEARIQNLPAFNEFLKVAALTSSALLNYTNVARETGVSAKVVRTYFSILEDTYLGFRVPPWKKSRNRRLIETEKFYLFDVGVTNYLGRREPRLGTPEFGKSMEQFILMELKAYQAYRRPEMEITYWRTGSGFEVDFILGEKELAIEVKASPRVHEGDIRSLKALLEDGPIKKCGVVSLERESRRLESNIEVIPWQQFLESLWAGQYV